MPLFLDRHESEPGTIDPLEVAQGHIRDIEIGARFGVRFLTYWSDNRTGLDFCLVDAPSAEAVTETHRMAHGDLPTRIITVDERTVLGFLGKIEDPPPGVPPSDTAFRTIMFTDLEGSTNMTQRLGDAGAMEVLRTHDAITREALAAWNGTEVKHTGDGVMASFISALDAVECARSLQRRLAGYNAHAVPVPLRVRIGLSAGEPVTEHGDIFGAAVQLARRCCDYGRPGQILVANVVRDLCIGKNVSFDNLGDVLLKGFEEPVRLYQVRWQEESQP